MFGQGLRELQCLRLLEQGVYTTHPFSGDPTGIRCMLILEGFSHRFGMTSDPALFHPHRNYRIFLQMDGQLNYPRRFRCSAALGSAFFEMSHSHRINVYLPTGDFYGKCR